MNKIFPNEFFLVLLVCITSCNDNSNQTYRSFASIHLDDEKNALFDVFWNDDESNYVSVIIIYNANENLGIINDDVNSILLPALTNQEKNEAVFFERMPIDFQKYVRVINHQQGIVSMTYQYDLLDADFTKFVGVIERNIKSENNNFSKFQRFRILATQGNKGIFLTFDE